MTANILPFVKMHGIGNDFVIIGPREALQRRDWASIARTTGDRHFGIGHDGLLLVEQLASPDALADFRMRMFNPDGSESEMCGNGIRCFAKYVYDSGLSREKQLRIATGAGVQHVELHVAGDSVDSVTVDMGTPEFSPTKIPVDLPGDYIVNVPLTIGGQTFAISCVSMGNPHAVAFTDDVQAVPLEQIGPLVEHHPWFPHRVNFEIVQRHSRRELTMRVWERGAGITLACGSGACAVMAVAHRQGKVDDIVTIHLPGGDLTLEWNGGDGMQMTGKAAYVFSGSWFPDPSREHE
ncbi:MAG: diaminopimelate epimerase [Chloroflexi bacterium]|nr:diaminopimelate epimerase [Chloroflexota bacterium]